MKLYPQLDTPALRDAVLQGLLIAGDSDAMVQLYRQAKTKEEKQALMRAITAEGGDAALELDRNRGEQEMRTHLIVLLAAGATFVAARPLPAKRICHARSSVRTAGLPTTCRWSSGAGAPCCYARDKRRHCVLEGNNWSMERTISDPRAKADRTLTVYMHVDHGAVDKVRAFGSTCVVDDAGQARRIEHVATAGQHRRAGATGAGRRQTRRARRKPRGDVDARRSGRRADARQARRREPSGQAARTGIVLARPERRRRRCAHHRARRHHRCRRQTPRTGDLRSFRNACRRRLRDHPPHRADRSRAARAFAGIVLDGAEERQARQAGHRRRRSNTMPATKCASRACSRCRNSRTTRPPPR